MFRDIAAGVAGALIAIGLVMIVQMTGHSVYPPPPDLDMSDIAAMRELIATMPVGALLFVVVSWTAGSFGGTLAACRFGNAKPLIYACVVGGLVLALTAYSLAIIPHPAWVAIFGVAGIVAGAWLGMQLGGRKDTA